jgi:hypothetical protein
MPQLLNSFFQSIINIPDLFSNLPPKVLGLYPKHCDNTYQKTKGMILLNNCKFNFMNSHHIELNSLKEEIGVQI